MRYYLPDTSTANGSLPSLQTAIGWMCAGLLLPSGFALWTDAHIPRTDKPVRFVWRAPFGLCWGMVDKWAKLPRPFVA